MVLITPYLRTHNMMGVWEYERARANLNPLFDAQTDSLLPSGETNNFYHHPVQTRYTVRSYFVYPLVVRDSVIEFLSSMCLCFVSGVNGRNGLIRLVPIGR